MKPRIFRHFSAIRALLGIASFCLIIGGLKVAKVILIPFLLAALISLACSYPLIWLLRKGVPKLIAIPLVMILLVVVFSGMALLLTRSLNEFTHAMPNFRQRFIGVIDKVGEFASQFGIDPSKIDLFQPLKSGAIIEMFGHLLSGLVGAFSLILLITFLVIFMLFEAVGFKSKLKNAFGGEIDITNLDAVVLDLQSYLGIKTFTSFLTGGSIWILLYFFAIDFAALWGLIAFFLNYIPVIGSIVASLPAIMFAFVQYGPQSAVIIAICYIVINVLISNMIEPFLMGNRLGLSPLVVFMSIAFWGWLWGPAGMLMSVPLTMIIKILLEHSKELQWIADLMGAPRDPGSN